MTTRTRSRQPVRLLTWALFVGACAINLYGIYAPSQPGPPLFAGFDKVAHLLSFALVMATGLLAGIRAAPLAAVLLVHAVTSELIQHALLPDRSGDPVDALTDVAGIALGWLAGHLLTRVVSRSGAPAGIDRDR